MPDNNCKPLFFTNPGELDLRLITTMGVNVKSIASPIGFFGTGLKYAIASVLRLGGEISITTADKVIKFHTFNDSIRGKEFSFIYMDVFEGGMENKIKEVQLAFTTALGSTWEPWMVYRELLSNALDEGGGVDTSYPVDEDLHDFTIVKVECKELEEAHRQVESFWLQGEPIWQNEKVAVYEGASQFIFYHGIRASTASSSAPVYSYSYSLLGQHKLTEDRMLANSYDARAEIAKALMQCDNEEIVKTILANDSEQALDFNWYGVKYGEVFKTQVLKRLKDRQEISQSIREGLEREHKEDYEETKVVSVPESFDAMEKEEPVAPKVVSSYYDYAHETDARLSGLEEQVKFWKACARKLSKRLEAEENISHVDFEAPV